MRSGNFTIAAIIVAVSMAWYNTESAWVTVLAALAVVAIAAVVSTDIYRATATVVVHAIRAVRDIRVAQVRATAMMHAQQQLTERERIKAQRAIGVQQAKGETWLVKTAAQASGYRLKAQNRMIEEQSVGNDAPFDEFLDAPYVVVEN